MMQSSRLSFLGGCKVSNIRKISVSFSSFSHCIILRDASAIIINFWSLYLCWQRLLSRIALWKCGDWSAERNLWCIWREHNVIAIHGHWCWLSINADLFHLTFAWETQRWAKLRTCHPSCCIHEDNQIEEYRRELKKSHICSVKRKRNICYEYQHFDRIKIILLESELQNNNN